MTHPLLVYGTPFSLVYAPTNTLAVEKFRGIGDAHPHDLPTYPVYPARAKSTGLTCVYCFDRGTPYTQGSLANDLLRDGQRIVWNKNNRKRKARAWPTTPSALAAHNFIGRAVSIVPEINQVNEVAGRNVFASFLLSILGERLVELLLMWLHNGV